MADEERVIFMLDPAIRNRMDEIFERQGVNLKTGLTRLIEFLIEAPPELHPIIFKQLPGRAAEAVARSVLDVGIVGRVPHGHVRGAGGSGKGAHPKQ